MIVEVGFLLKRESENLLKNYFLNPESLTSPCRTRPIYAIKRPGRLPINGRDFATISLEHDSEKPNDARAEPAADTNRPAITTEYLFISLKNKKRLIKRQGVSILLCLYFIIFKAE